MNIAEIIESPIQVYLKELLEEFKHNKKGLLADYIPELAKADENLFGISLVTVDGHIYQVGESQQKFTIQSISKPFTYGLTLDSHGTNKVLSKIGVEPSGEAFNEISLEETTGRPFNPMINAGAIATTGLVSGDDVDSRFLSILKAYEKFSASELSLDENVYRSESETGNRNRAIAYLLKNSNIIENNTEETLDLYFKQCSILVNCRDLAVMGATLANNGINPITGVVALKSENVEKVLSIMSTCGMYDYAGGWVYDVGMPAKSGVAGGVMAVLPGQFGIAVFSPLLDLQGNSVRGIEVCRKISVDFGLHMFDSSKASNSVIRAKYDATTITSKRNRTKDEFNVLQQYGSQIKVYELAGDLIFSATDFVLETALKKLHETNYFIFDFKRVTSTKLSACYLFAKLIRIMVDKGKHIFITNTDYQFVKLFKKFLNKDTLEEVLNYQVNDTALEWCENELIKCYITPKSINEKTSLSEQILINDFTEKEISYLKGVMVKKVFESGDDIVKEGDLSQSIYFITIGEVSINLISSKNNNHKRVATLSSGMSFGEMSFFDGSERSATVNAESYVECFELPYSTFDSINNEYSNIKQKILINITVDLSNKLRKVNQEIRAYQ
jgi:glutaminase